MAASENLESSTVARRIAGECIGLRARQLGRLISRVYDDALRIDGVTNVQLGLLASIEIAGPIHPGELARLSGTEKSTVARNVRGLMAHGWVRAEDAVSEPGRLLTLSPSGRQLLVDAFPSWSKAQANALALLGSEALETLDRFLQPVRHP